MADEETSLMDDLAAAWEGSDDNDDEQEHDDHDTSATDTGDTASYDDDDNDDAGDEGGEGAPQAAAAPGDAEGDGGDGPGGEPAGEAEDGPPAGLSPLAREAWKDTPEAVRKDIAKREADYAAGIVKYSENAKRAEAMDHALMPFQQFLAINGNQPAQTISGVLQTASILQMGSPQQKAQMVAQMIQQFGVDIQALDSAIVGEAPPEGFQQQQHIQQAVNQAIAPYQQQLQAQQQAQQHAQQQAHSQVQTEVQKFSADPKNEFYGDVSNDMADLMEMAANRGRELSMADAYRQACQLNPQISKILQARADAELVARKRPAAASISGGPAGDGVAGLDDDDMRGTIEAAWSATGRV